MPVAEPTFDSALEPTAATVGRRPSSSHPWSFGWRVWRWERSDLIIGAALAVTGVATGQLVIVAVGAIAGGAGQGAGFGASLRVLAPLAESRDRGGLFAAIYLIAYASYGVPVLIAGALSGPAGLTEVVLVYGAAVVGFAVWAFISISTLARRTPAEAITP